MDIEYLQDKSDDELQKMLLEFDDMIEIRSDIRYEIAKRKNPRVPYPKKVVNLYLETLTDLQFNSAANSYFDFMFKLIEAGSYIQIVSAFDGVITSTIKDEGHLKNFKKRFNF